MLVREVVVVMGINLHMEMGYTQMPLWLGHIKGSHSSRGVHMGSQGIANTLKDWQKGESQ